MKVLGWLWRQLFRIRTRLLLVNALIVAVPLLGVGFARFYEREMLRAVEGDMIHQSQVIAELVGDDLHSQSAMLRRAAHQTTTRLRIVDATGTVVADSAGVVGENLGTRREIRRGQKGRYGASTRVLDERGISVMFTAIPIVRDRGVIGIVYASRSTHSVQVAMHRLRKSIYKILYASLAATAILTLFFSTTVSRPLAALATRARRLAAGDRTVKLGSARRDEIGELARALDEMATELDGRSAEVAELAANISHELKSPLTSMRGAAELLVEGAGDCKQTRDRFLGNILSDVNRLDRLVTRMLELSRARPDSEPLATVDLRELVSRAASDAMASDRLVLEMPAAPLLVRARRGHFAAAVRNLVDNALTHGDATAPVVIRVSRERRCAHVEVHNSGDAIPKRARARMWDRFYTTCGTSGGTGLGLPIVSAVARAHGGSAHLKSSVPGRTVFALAIPTC